MTPSLSIIDSQWRLFYSDGKIYQITESAAKETGDKAIHGFDRDGDNAICRHADGTRQTLNPLTNLATIP